MENKKLLEELDKMFQKYLEPIMDFIEIQRAINEVNLRDLSQRKRAVMSTDKPMPEIINGWVISNKPCRRCGGKITWDLYDEKRHRYPDHVDEEGMFYNCGQRVFLKVEEVKKE